MSSRVWGKILNGVVQLLLAEPQLVNAGLVAYRFKKPQSFGAGNTPALFVQAGKRIPLGNVTGGFLRRAYQVFAVVVAPGNYEFRSGQDVIPDIGELVQGTMLVTTIPDTPVRGSREEENVQYDGLALEAGYEKNVTEIWYTTTEPRQ